MMSNSTLLLISTCLFVCGFRFESSVGLDCYSLPVKGAETELVLLGPGIVRPIKCV